jgi:WD40 repeat protein
MKDATAELKKTSPDYGFAIAKYRAAQVCNPEKRVEIDGYIDAVNQKILALNALAEKRRLEAEAEKEKAVKAQKEAEFQKEEAKRQELISIIAGKGLAATTNFNHSYLLLDYAAEKSNYESELAVENRDKFWQDYTQLFYERSIETPDSKGLSAVAISPLGNYVLGGYDDGIARMWDIQKQAIVWTSDTLKKAVTSVAISYSGIIAIGGGHEILVYSRINNYKIPSVLSFQNATVNSLSISKNESKLAIGFNNQVNDLFAAMYDMATVLAVIKNTSMEELETGKPRATLSDGEQVLKGHINQVSAIAFSPDGQCVATASWDKTAIVRTLDGKPKFPPLYGHAAALTALTYSPDGRFIATTGLDRMIKVWDALTGQLLSNLRGSDAATLRSLAFSPDSRLIISTDEAGKIRVQNLNGQIEFDLNGHESMVTCVHANYFDPLSNYVATGDANGIIRFWRVKNRKPKLSKGHEADVTVARYSPDGQYIVSGSSDKTIKLWHISGRLEQTFKGHFGSIKDVDISADGRYIVSGARDNYAMVWSSDGLFLAKLDAHVGSVYAVRFMPDQRRILTASSDGKVYIWHRHGGKPIDSLIGHGGRLSTLAVTPDSKTILLGGDNGIISHWQHDGKKWQKRTEYTEHTERGMAQKFTAQIAISPDGKKWAAQAGDSTAMIHVFGQPNGVKVRSPYSALIAALSFSPTGDSLLVVGSKGDMSLYALKNNAAKRLDVQTHYVSNFDESNGITHISSAAFSPLGTEILTTSNFERTVRVWDTEGVERMSMKGTLSKITNLSWRAAMKQYVTVDNRSLTYWDSLGNYIRQIPFDTRITASSFSTQFDSVLLVQDTAAKIFDLKKAETASYLSNNADKLMLMPDGKNLLTFESNYLRLYRAADTKLLFTTHKELPASADASPYKFAISAKGNIIVAFNSKDSAYVFDDKLRPVNSLSLPQTKQEIAAAAISPNEQNIVFADDKGVLTVYERKTKLPLFSRKTMMAAITNIQFLDNDHFTTTHAPTGQNTEGVVAIWFLPIEEKKKNLKTESRMKPIFPLHRFDGTSIFDYKKEKDGSFLVVSKGYDFELYPLALAHTKISNVPTLSILDKAKYGLSFDDDSTSCNRTADRDTLAQCIDCVLHHYGSEVEVQKQKAWLQYATRYARKLKDSVRTERIKSYNDEVEIAEDNFDRRKHGNTLTYYQNRLKNYLLDAYSLSRDLQQNTDDASLKRDLAQKYISAAYMYIFLDKPLEAIRLGEKALTIEPKQTWAYTNIALGYLFSNQLDKAKTIYLKWQDKPWQESGHNAPDAYAFFKDAFLSDFEELKVAGKTHKHLVEIEKLLTESKK